MKILMLVNWKVEYADKPVTDKQPPDYVVTGQPYWFFRYFPEECVIHVDVIDIRSFPWLEKFEKNGIRFYIWQTLRALPKLKKYDMVLSHGMQSGIVLCLFRRIFGKGRYKHVVFDIGAFNSARESGRSLKLMQFASKSIDGVIYHTKSQKEYYEKCHPWLMPKSRFIPFGTDTEFFTPEEKEQDYKEQSNSYILCVGYHKRDWDTLLAAYGQLMENKSGDMTGEIGQVRLRLIGNCSIKAEAEGVEVLDPVSVTELKTQIQNALFCVLPLQQFNYSYGQMTLLQQMALGKAVIVANVSSIQAYRGEENLLLYEPENTEELTACMRELLLNGDKREQMGRKARASVLDTYNERNMAKEIYAVIEEWMEIK
ncbi:MAG: glycosyltransferase family 4 protein [Lachnospiraceae bacterium]|nr:glycosyltransferase family 4 protein [Lachnospiraceae bacterium]